LRTGVQLRPWLVEGSSLDEACAQAVAAGFEAAEFGYHFAKPLGAGTVAKMLGANGLSAAALHLGLDWANASDDEVRELAGGAALMAAALGASYILASTQPRGLDGEDALAVATKANHRLRSAGTLAQEHGVTLCLHNHAWEFVREGIFETLSAGLLLAVDVAHLWRAGQDVEARLVEWGQQVRYLHLRDAANNMWAPVLGEGELPLARWVTVCAPAVDWGIVELEPDPLYPQESSAWPGTWTERAARSMAFLAQSGLASPATGTRRASAPRRGYG
jgi:sugar phosphate isomerase/epimerase